MGKSDEYWTLFIVDSLHRLVLVLSPSTSHLVNDDCSLPHGKKWGNISCLSLCRCDHHVWV